ncbi:MAG: hypothetical protein ACYDAE_00030, partial [Steroidobacteraceae bacterium]
DVSMFVGLPVAAGAYLLACRSMDLEADRAAAAAADDGLEPQVATSGAAAAGSTIAASADSMGAG